MKNEIGTLPERVLPLGIKNSTISIKSDCDRDKLEHYLASGRISTSAETQEATFENY